jgi:hypothetical protein
MSHTRYDWQPGNGTRYDLCYGPMGKKTLLTWLRHGGSGGPSIAFFGYLHYSYMMEKMNVGIADAVGILKFLEKMGHEVGYPNHLNYDTCIGETHIRVIE